MQLNRKSCYARSRSSQCSQEEEQVPFIKGNKSINSYPIHILIPKDVILIFIEIDPIQLNQSIKV